MGFIYKISSTKTDKVYIGKTSTSIEERYNSHIRACKAGYTYAIYNAMRKYGIDTFSVEEIEECDDSVLNEKEQYWIAYYDSCKNGYNETLGGEGVIKFNYKELAEAYQEIGSEKAVAEKFNCSWSTVKKACEANGIEIKKGLNDYYWNSEEGQKRKKETAQRMKEYSTGRKLTEEHKQKLSEAHKGLLAGEKNYWYGKSFSEEHRKKLSQNSAWAKKVRCIETGEIFHSGLKAAQAKNLKSSSGISKCCLQKKGTAGGYHWEFVDEGGE